MPREGGVHTPGVFVLAGMNGKPTGGLSYGLLFNHVPFLRQSEVKQECCSSAIENAHNPRTIGLVGAAESAHAEEFVSEVCGGEDDWLVCGRGGAKDVAANPINEIG